MKRAIKIGLLTVGLAAYGLLLLWVWLIAAPMWMQWLVAAPAFFWFILRPFLEAINKIDADRAEILERVRRIENILQNRGFN
jgi:4-hydroxybenzoate polyprenyltransferase